MDDLEEIITEELNRLSPANAEAASSSEDTGDLSEEDGEAEDPPYAAVMPETFLSLLHMESRITNAIENALLTGKHDGVPDLIDGDRDPEEALQETGHRYQEDHLQLRNRIISELEVTASEEALTENGHTAGVLDDDFYREAEKRFSSDLENLEKRLKEDREKRIVENEKEKEYILKERKEEKDRRRHRYRIFEEELKGIEWETMPQDFGTKEENALQLDLCKQEAIIAELQKQLEEERQTVEAAQAKERRREEELRISAAVKIQASVRTFLVHKRTAAILRQRRKERMKKHWAKEETLRRCKEEQKMREDEERGLIDKDKCREREEEIRKQTEKERRGTREKDECREREEEIRKQTDEEGTRTREKDECREREEEIRKQTEGEGRRTRKKEECREREEEIRKQTEKERRGAREKDECREREEEIRKQTDEEGTRTREKDECRKREEEIRKQTEKERRGTREKDECKEREEEIRKQTEGEGRRMRKKDECREREEEIRRQTDEKKKGTREKDEEEIRKQTEGERRGTREKDEEEIRKQTEGRRTREKDECREREEEIRKHTEEKKKGAREKDEEIRKQTEGERRGTREKDECREREKEIRKHTEGEGRRTREKDECREREEEIRKQTDEEGTITREKDECREREEEIRKQTEKGRRGTREKDECREREEEIRKQTDEEGTITREKDECREREEEIRKQTEKEGRRRRRKGKDVYEHQQEKLNIHIRERNLRKEEGKRNEEQEENMKREEQLKRMVAEKQTGEEKETWSKERFMGVDLSEPQTPKLEEPKNKMNEDVQKQNQLERNPGMEKGNVHQTDNRFQENHTKHEIVKIPSQDLAWRINGNHGGDSAPSSSLIPYESLNICKTQSHQPHYDMHSQNDLLISGNKTGTWKLPDNQHVRLCTHCEAEQLDSSSMNRASLFSCVYSEELCISPENAVSKGPEMTCLHTNRAVMNPSESLGPRGGLVDESLHHPAPDELLSKDNVCLSASAERKRLRWMHACTPWSKIASWEIRGYQREKKAVTRCLPNKLPPIAADVLLRTGTCSSMKQLTTVILEDLPGCSLSTLSECIKLQALTLRRCGLVALEGISRCQDLRYIDVQENSIKFINCQDLANLRVLLLNRNQLTSVHGLESATNLSMLELSYNSISRISGLETLVNLQRLLIDHNQLISTRGLKGVCTLLYLDCAHNHLSRLDGIESCVLLGTLRLQGNNLSEPPHLSDHVLLRELRLDDNSLSSLDSVSACWLPLLQCLSTSRNSITQLPALSDFLSLLSLDISYNCLSDLANVRLGLRGCQRLRDINVLGNPFQREVDWRSTLLETLPGLRQIDSEQIGTSLASAKDREVVAGSFTELCQAQAEQLEREPDRLDRGHYHHSENLLHLAIGYRKAHECGEMSFNIGPEAGPHSDLRILQEGAQGLEAFSQERKTLLQVKPPFLASPRDKNQSEQDPELLGPTLVDSKDPENCTLPSRDSQRLPEEMDSVGMTVVLNQRHKDRHENLNGNRDTGKHRLIHSGVRMDGDWAATLIQTVWRGYSLRQKLAAALASVQISEGEDDFDEVDVDEFAFDEAVLDEAWITLDLGGSPPPTIPVSDRAALGEAWITPDPGGSPPPMIPISDRAALGEAWITPDPGGSPPATISSDQRLRPKPPGGYCPSLLPRPRGAWQSSEDNAELDPPPRNIARRNETSAACGDCSLSEKSEQILQGWGITDRYTAHLMLKRAQKMGPKKQHRKLLDESVWRCRHAGSIPWHKRPVSAESERFLPEIDLGILNGGRVQLMAGSGSRDGPDQERLSESSSTALSPRRKEHNPAGRPSVGHARRAAPSSAGATSAPSRKERISFRDDPVQLSGGWGGGKKRARQGK